MNLCPQHVDHIDMQLLDSSAIAVSRDATKVDRPSNHHSSQPVACRLSPLGLCSFASQLRRVDAGQPDLFSGCCATGVAVVAALDGDAFAKLSRSRSPQHQQEEWAKGR